MIKARVVPVPSDSVLAPLYVGADLLDAFAIHLPAGASDNLEVLARVAFERQADNLDSWRVPIPSLFASLDCGPELFMSSFRQRLRRSLVGK